MLKWEEVKQNTGSTLYRTKVPNGWLVKEVNEVHLEIPNGSFILENTGYEWTSTMAFVPDIHHEWDISDDKNLYPVTPEEAFNINQK